MTPKERERWRLKKTKRVCTVEIISARTGTTFVLYRFHNRMRTHTLERFLELFERAPDDALET